MRVILPLLMIVLFSACSTGEKEQPIDMDWNKEKSTELNKNLAQEEEIQIKLFLAHHADWKMKETGTGLKYFIYKESEGDSARVGQIAQVELKVQLLDGKEVYKTANDEVEEFVIDKSQLESGIHEGIKKMRAGEKAKLIIPSHLGHGLVGDFDKVPPLAVLVVDVHLIKIKL
jgi:FKBP-type peptidyl-prolyl cis-trans isomerase